MDAAKVAGAVLFLFLLLVSPTPALAQQTAGDGWYLQDGADDLTYAAAAAAPAIAFGSADLLGFGVRVDSGNLSFRIETAASPNEVPVANSVDYTIDFTAADLPYRVAVQRLQYASEDYLSGPGFDADFLVFDAATNDYRSLLEPPIVPDTARGSFEVRVPLLEVRGSDGLPLVSGQLLAQAVLRSAGTFSGSTGWTDTAPDSGTVDIPVNIPVQDAVVRLSPATSVKVSNGEPRLMIFTTSVTNTDSQYLDVDVVVREVPEWWQLRVGSPHLSVPAGATVPIYFAVQTLGRHVHGTFDQVNFTLTDQFERRTTGSLRIDYHEIPQPSGHHPKVFFHTLGTQPLVPPPSAEKPVSGYFNTLEEDERDTKQGLENMLSGGAASWRIPLSPQLQLGLLADNDGKGQLTLCLKQVGPLMPQGAEIWGTLSTRIGTEEPVTLFESERKSIEISDQTGCTDLELNLVGAASIDPAPDKNLILSGFANLDDMGVTVGTTRVHLMPGTWAHLPLHEYVEPLPKHDGQQISWSLSDPLPAPLGVSQLRLGITSTASQTMRLSLDVISPIDWSLKFATRTIEVPANGQVFAILDVQVPDGAVLGRPVPAIVLATQEDGQAILGSLVFVPHETPASVSEPPKDTPLPAPPALILLLLACAFSITRRRG